ncbi:MAG: DNA-directed RNA polymerase subunit omega [Nitrospirota bacterium]|jgi:DNA-directed RNA polymerase omega subunit
MDIVSLPIEIDKEKIDSRFRLVAIAAQRAKELAFGARPRVDTRYTKFTTTALEETIEGKLEFLVGEEARAANEKARKFDYKRFLEEKRKEVMPEDLSELERDLKVYLTEREEADRQGLEDLFAERKQEEDEETSEG